MNGSDKFYNESLTQTTELEREDVTTYPNYWRNPTIEWIDDVLYIVYDFYFINEYGFKKYSAREIYSTETTSNSVVTRTNENNETRYYYVTEKVKEYYFYD